MARSDRHLRLATSLVGGSLALALVAAMWMGWFEPLELLLYDARAKQFQHFTPPPTDRIVHADIDDAALEAVGAWPWPRTVMADMVDEMSAAGAKAIVLDVLYSEPQKPEWEPVGAVPKGGSGVGVGGTFRLVDHDANLAAAFARTARPPTSQPATATRPVGPGGRGVVMLPSALQFISVQRQTPGVKAATELLAKNLELGPDQLTAALKEKGTTDADAADVAGVFFDVRRAAARARAVQEVEKGLLAKLPKPPAGPVTRPSTQPTTAPAPRPAASAADALLAAATDPNKPDAARLAMRRALFPNRDPLILSAENRLADESLDYARSAHALAAFGRPVVPNVPVFRTRSDILPVPVLIESAAASGFVDYPNLSDGSVRSVPLFVEFQGKLFPTMGLQTACMLLEVDPADLKIAADGVTIPAGTLADGTPRRQLTIPARTGVHTLASGKVIEVPLTMDIPFFGGRNWTSMYDPAHPERKAQHVSLSAVYGAVRGRQKLQNTLAGADQAARDVLGFAVAGGVDARAEYDARRIARDTPYDAAVATIDWVLAQAEQVGMTPGQNLNDPKLAPKERLVFIACDALADARNQLGRLAGDLHRSRSELRAALDGKGVIVGWIAGASVADVKPTPLHAACPGVVVHGVVANAILTGDVWRTLPPWVAALTAAALGLIATAAVTWLSPVKSLAAVLVLTAAYVAVNCALLFDYGNTILDLGGPTAAIGVAWAGGTITRLVGEARERARIVKRFSTYVDPDIVNYFLETRDEAQLAGKRQDTAIVFTDLEGFTTLSEKLGEDVVPVLNDFMGRAVSVIKAHRGVVNKFLGDGILFFFNAPRANSTYVADAVDCILDLQKMMVGFNADLKAKGLPQLKLRAGVTTGTTITGDAGSQGRTDYTVIGDLVNLAARLESANKFFGTANLVTEPTINGAGERFLFRPIGSILVMGKLQGVKVYEALAYAKYATDEQKALVALTTDVSTTFAAGDAAGCLEALEKLEAVTGKTKLIKSYRAIVEPHARGEAAGPMPKEIVLDAK